jgi:hypothetical protein
MPSQSAIFQKSLLCDTGRAEVIGELPTMLAANRGICR